MKPINNFVHYVWVGTDPIPATYMDNFNRAKSINPSYNFKIWHDADIVANAKEYEELYNTSSVFHKLQIARYTIMNSFGGLYTDFDIYWKINFDVVYGLFDSVDLVFPKRNSLYFYNRGQKTSLIDDFVIMAHPNITKEFLTYCKLTEGQRDSKSPKQEPFSVYALTEWLFTKESKTFISHKLIDSNKDSILAVHANKGSWDAK